ncbi:MAG: hypothetical protein AB1449_14190 [Chloroflexota bacterium]
MSDNTRHDLVRSPGGGVFHGLALRIKLILRLMADRRVNPLLKLLPLGSLVYLLIPDLVPGPVDDAAMIWLLAYLFVELCPAEVVAEHMQALTSVIDAEWREIEDDPERDRPG